MKGRAATTKTGGSKYVVRQRARRREPLPEKEIKIRRPKPIPEPPGKPNWLTMLPMVIMALTTGGLSFFLFRGIGSPTMRVLATALPMLLMASTMVGVQQYMHRRTLKEHSIKVQQINDAYNAHLESIREELDKFTTIQYRILNRESPPFRELEQRVIQKKTTLWERQLTDDDFLSLRVGTAALPPCVEVKVPDEDDDPRLEKAKKIVAEYSLVPDLPLTVNINKLGSVGIRGRRSEALYTAFMMVANIVVHQSPDEVQLYIFSHRQNAADLWGWARWLPHTNALRGGIDNQSRLSFKPETDEPIMLELSQELRQRSDRGLNLDSNYGQPQPHIVAIFDQVPELQGHKALSMLLTHDPYQDGNSLHASAIFVDHPVPPTVSAMVNVQEDRLDYRETWAADANQISHTGQAEMVVARKMEVLSRRLAPMHTEKGLSAGKGSLPNSVRLVEILGATNPNHIQLKHLYAPDYDPRKVMKFPVGLDTDLKPLNIILRETGQGGHGTHAMLAGMTGTGKSVLLQAMVLSMALTNPPAHLNFVLADFKGGASELAKLKNLPHAVGFVTDLNEALVERFRIALEAEVRRRKVLFDTAKETLGAPVANIRTYNKLCADKPLPHLVVLLDEFAHGLNINPNLRSAMDTIAAQGRALGVHLILSTQRAADFDNKIRPNIDVRMSLRVASREDSKTMFNREEAYSQLTRPGQAYLQVGDNEIFEMFQAARADIPFLPDGTKNILLLDEFAIYKVASDGRRQLLYKHDVQEPSTNGKEDTSTYSEAEVLVERIQDYCADHYPPSRIICLPPLPAPEDFPLLPLLDDLPLFVRWQDEIWTESKNAQKRLQVPLGMLDLPAKQAQNPFIVNLNERDGNYAVLGPGGAGKSVFLRSLILGLAASHTPDDLHIYVLGRGPALTVFEDLPHCGGIIQASETERITRLLDFIDKTIKARRQKMAETKVSHMDALRAARPDDLLPAIVVIFEDFTGFKADHDQKVMEMQRIAGDVKAADIHLVIASTSINAIHTRIQDNLRNRVALGLESSIAYIDALGKRAPVLAEINGRGYTVIDQEILECQIAAPARSKGILPNSQTATEELTEIIDAMHKAWKGRNPQVIEELPVQITLEQLWFRCPPASMLIDPVSAAVGLDYDDLAPVTIDFGRLEPVAIVSGPPQSGKTECLATIILSTARQLSPEQIEIIVLAPKRNRLRYLHKLPHVQYAQTTGQCQEVLNSLIESLEDRVRRYRDSQAELAISGASQVQQLPKRILLIIDDFQRLMRDEALPSLVERCYAAGQEIGINIIIADTGNNLIQTKNQFFNIQFIQNGFKMNCGIALSTDPNDLTPMGLQFKLKQALLKLHEPKIGRGRAFLSYQGRESVVQFAMVADRNNKESEYLSNLETITNEIYIAKSKEDPVSENIKTIEHSSFDDLSNDSTLLDRLPTKTLAETDKTVDAGDLVDPSPGT